ncbi:long-chain fatty acid CoA ligase [Scheffersomyces xylosifermentans]|uniref:long-chain fatty acid CoA ligase n=1 Tax=Scheffersomyces xylosifermentans TaxID=1304137 RepID=UPI00315DACD8
MSVPPSLPQLKPGEGYGSDDSEYLIETSKGQSILGLAGKILPLDGQITKDGVAIPNTEKPGFSPIYRNAAFPHKVKVALSSELDTYHSLFKAANERYGSSPVMAHRQFDYEKKVSAPNYTLITSDEVNQLKKELGSGLLYLLQNNPFKDSLKYSSHSKIDTHRTNFKQFNKENYSFILTIFSANRYEWVLTDLMCSSYSITSTALYDTLGAITSKYILELTESPVVVSSKDHIYNLIELKQKYPEELGQLILIISMDPLTSSDLKLVQFAEDNKIKLFAFQEVIKVGAIFPVDELPPSKDTVFTISFTSGTTGANPKGVMLTQSNITAGILFFLAHVNHIVGWKSFSFLPLAHIFERQSAAFTMVFGGCVGFPQIGGSPLTLIEDLKIWKPHIMSNVPRVYNKLESALKSATIDSNSPLKRSIFGSVFKYKLDAQSQYDGAEGRHFLYDNVVISKLRSTLGFDNMRLILTGSAPISPDTVRFLKAALNVGFIQGYGLTETNGGLSATINYEANPGSCGPPSISSEIRLRDIPEMGYGTQTPGGASGELLLRGPHVFAGYFKNEEENRKAFDDEGWFYSGDVARVDSKTGRMYIIDRVKNFFKLAQGEYVTPEKVENTYLSSNSNLTQCYAHGDSLQHYLVGIVGLDPIWLEQYLVDNFKVDPSTLSSPQSILDYANKTEVKRQILRNLNSNIESKLLGFEKLQNIYIEFEPLRLDRDVVTPTLKLKRAIASKFFANQIKKMYEEGSLIKGPNL